jgi:hypothetical protein
MPRPMQVKIFMNDKPSELERQINAWLADLGSASVIKTETTVTAAADKPDDGAHPCIVVTVWYEAPESN